MLLQMLSYHVELSMHTHIVKFTLVICDVWYQFCTSNFAAYVSFSSFLVLKTTEVFSKKQRFWKSQKHSLAILNYSALWDQSITPLDISHWNGASCISFTHSFWSFLGQGHLDFWNLSLVSGVLPLLALSLPVCFQNPVCILPPFSFAMNCIRIIEVGKHL